MLSLVDTGGPEPVGDELRGTVTRVADGDTLRVELDSGREERVRLLGIDAPELNPAECFGGEARARARALADGQRVRLVLDATQGERDRFERVLAYVLLGESDDLGRRLVTEGYASVFVFDRPFKRVESYRDAQDSARRGSRGLWGNCSSRAGS